MKVGKVGMGWAWLIAGALAAGGAACAALGEHAADDPRLAERAGRFEGRFLAVSDVDMAGTAYADGLLEPLAGRATRSHSSPADPSSRLAGVELRRLLAAGRRGLSGRPPRRGGRDAPGSPPGTEAYAQVAADFPAGTRLSVFGGGGGAPPRRDARWARPQPRSEGVHGGGRRLLIATETEDGELLAVELGGDGAIRAARSLPLAAEVRPADVEKKVRTLHVAPDGVTIAVNVANRRIQFFRLALDAAGAPEAALPLGKPSADVGRRLSVGKWTPDGRHFVVTDTNGGSGPHPLLTARGAVLVLRPPRGADEAPKLVGRATVGRFPEGFDLSPDGNRVATVNLERTFLPELAVLERWPGALLLGLAPRSILRPARFASSTASTRRASCPRTRSSTRPAATWRLRCSTDAAVRIAVADSSTSSRSSPAIGSRARGSPSRSRAVRTTSRASRSAGGRTGLEPGRARTSSSAGSRPPRLIRSAFSHPLWWEGRLACTSECTSEGGNEHEERLDRVRGGLCARTGGVRDGYRLRWVRRPRARCRSRP